MFTQTSGGRNHIEIITWNQELSRAKSRALSRAKEQNTKSTQGDLFDRSAPPPFSGRFQEFACSKCFVGRLLAHIPIVADQHCYLEVVV